MILTITLNPSVDKRYNIKNFEKDNIFRTEEYQYTVGGKGLNVSKVVNILGEKVFATGFLGGYNGKFILDGLNKINIENKFVEINGENRSCLAIISDDGSQTEILERGPEINKNEMEEFLKIYDELLDKVNIVSASGSIPYGIENNIYSKLIEMAKKKNKIFILDTSGEALKKGIDAGPYLIKPNIDEISYLLGKEIKSLEDIIIGCREIQKKGIEIIIVSLGEEGSVVFKDKKIYKINIPNVKVSNPVGSGDAMIAGIVVGFIKELEFEEILKLGAACGTANAMEDETGKVDKKNIEILLKEIQIEKIGDKYNV